MISVYLLRKVEVNSSLTSVVRTEMRSAEIGTGEIATNGYHYSCNIIKQYLISQNSNTQMQFKT